MFFVTNRYIVFSCFSQNCSISRFVTNITIRENLAICFFGSLGMTLISMLQVLCQLSEMGLRLICFAQPWQRRWGGTHIECRTFHRSRGKISTSYSNNFLSVCTRTKRNEPTSA